VTNYRAIHDQKVVDAWAMQLARRRRRIGKTQLLLFLVLVLLAALMFFVRKEIFVLLFFAAGAALVIVRLIDRRTLLCPNCHRSPIDSIQRGTAENADFCTHCYYWLKTPYGNSRDAQV
jgi:hypothetical protein